MVLQGPGGIGGYVRLSTASIVHGAHWGSAHWLFCCAYLAVRARLLLRRHWGLVNRCHQCRHICLGLLELYRPRRLSCLYLL